MAAKQFTTDSGKAYRAHEIKVTPAMLADDHALATILRHYLEQFGAVVVRVVPPSSASAVTDS